MNEYDVPFHNLSPLLRDANLDVAKNSRITIIKSFLTAD